MDPTVTRRIFHKFHDKRNTQFFTMMEMVECNLHVPVGPFSLRNNVIANQMFRFTQSKVIAISRDERSRYE